MNIIHRRGPDAWTPSKPTVAQQIAKRGPILPMVESRRWWQFWRDR